MIRNLMGMFLTPLWDTNVSDPAGGGGTSTQAAPGDSGKGQGTTTPPAAGSSTTTGAQAGKEGQPSGTPPAAGEFEYTVGGKTLKVSRDEAIALAQKGHDYTRKTQELAESRKKLDSEYQTRLRAAVDQEIARLRQQQNRDDQDPPDPLTEIKTRQDQIEAQIASDRWTRSINDLKSKYPLLNEELFALEVSRSKADWDQLEELAQQHQAARDAERNEIFEKIINDDKHPLSAKARQKIIDDYIAQKEKEAKAKTGGGEGGSPSSKKEKTEPILDFNAVDRRVAEKLERI